MASCSGVGFRRSPLYRCDLGGSKLTRLLLSDGASASVCTTEKPQLARRRYPPLVARIQPDEVDRQLVTVAVKVDVVRPDAAGQLGRDRHSGSSASLPRRRARPPPRAPP